MRRQSACGSNGRRESAKKDQKFTKKTNWDGGEKYENKKCKIKPLVRTFLWHPGPVISRWKMCNNTSTNPRCEGCRGCLARTLPVPCQYCSCWIHDPHIFSNTRSTKGSTPEIHHTPFLFYLYLPVHNVMWVWAFFCLVAHGAEELTCLSISWIK